MKAIALLLCGLVGAAFAAAPKASKAAPGKASSKKKGSKATARRPARPPRQTQPTPERYKEIQQALIDKGFLEGSPTGQWDNQSVTALNRFKEAQKLNSDGKLDSLTLIALGLGPKRREMPQKTETP